MHQNHMSHSFEINSADIATALRNNWARVSNSHGMSFCAMGEQMMDELDLDAIDSAAMDAGAEMIDQKDSAHTEIEKQLVENGILIDMLNAPFGGQFVSHQSMNA